MDDPPKDPAKPASTGFRGKTAKKNNLHRKKRKRSSEGHADDVAPVPQTDPPRPTIRHILEAQGAKRKLTNSELQLELKRAYADLDRARSQILEKDKCITSLTKRNQSLKDQVHSASDAVRTAKSSAKEAKAAARSTCKEAEQSVNTMARALEQKEGELAGVKSDCSKQIRLKDAETRHKLLRMKEEMESTIIAKVDSEVGKSEDRRQRHVAKIKAQKDAEINKTIREMDSHVKHHSAVAEHNRDLAASQSLELSKLKRSHEEEVAKLNSRYADTLRSVRSNHAEKVSSLRTKLQEKDNEIKELQDLANDVSEEYYKAERNAKISATKAGEMRVTAMNRLNKYKSLEQKLHELQEATEEERYNNDLVLLENELLKEQVEEIGNELIDAYHRIEELKPYVIEKKGKPKAWDHRLTQLVVEMLANRTPPSCIGPNILATAQLLCPNSIKIVEMPSIRFYRYCRSILVYVSHTVAAYRFAKAPSIIQSYFDGTGRRQTHMQNFSARLEGDDGGYCTLDSSILAQNETSESIGTALVRAFDRGKEKLDFWRDVTNEMYPTKPQFAAMIPQSSELTLTKNRASWRTSDTCNGALKLQRILKDLMKQIATEEGLSPDEVKDKMALCWQHLRNVWIGAASDAACDHVNTILADHIKDIPSIYRVTIDPVDLFRCVEKYFGETANYAKGKGKLFFTFMQDNHPGAYLYPICRACGGARQDLSVEGAPGILMNLPYYLQFLHWRSTVVGGKSDAILATKLYIMLRSVEVVALLRVLSILHLAVCMPTRWLSAKTHELSEFDFGYYDMGRVLTCMEQSFESIIDDPSLILDEEFMLEQMFKVISDQVDPFAEYIQHMYEQKVTLSVTGVNNDDLFYDDLRFNLFYPSRADIVQSHHICHGIAVVVAVAFLKEFRDTSKPTHHYLDSAGGKYSLGKISEIERLSGFGIEASNSIAESVHASSTHSLKVYGTIRLDSAAAEGQTRSNNDFGRCYDNFVNPGRERTADEEDNSKSLGAMIKLPIELQASLIAAGKRYAPRLRKAYDDALATQHKDTLERQKLAGMKACQDKEEEYIEALDYLQRFNSDRCWRSEERALEVYNVLPSEAARLKAVKEQITIRRKGTIGERAGHKWSQNGYYYTSRELLDHFINVILPMEANEPVPTEPPVDFGGIVSDQHRLGTMTELDYINDNINGVSIEQIKANALKERERRMAGGETDQDANLQSNIQPKFDDTLIGFKVEYCFSYDEEDGTPYLSWCDGKIVSIVNQKTRTVLIEWNKDKVAEGDALISKHKLLVSRWNPNIAKMGAWRAYIGE